MVCVWCACVGMVYGVRVCGVGMMYGVCGVSLWCACVGMVCGVSVCDVSVVCGVQLLVVIKLYNYKTCSIRWDDCQIKHSHVLSVTCS